MNVGNRLRALFAHPPRAIVDDRSWHAVTHQLHLLDGWQPDELQRLRAMTATFLSSKSLEGAGELQLDDYKRVAIAVQACVPVLGLGLDWYREWRSVIVYPSDFIARHEYVDDAGVMHAEARTLSGEAWPAGPVVLSWESVAEGLRGDLAGNVVIHEMAHKLDLGNGAANGMPPLHSFMNREAWTGTLSDAYQRFCTLVESGRETPFDEYAAEDPGEFFAVLSEAFFVEPEHLNEVDPAIYRQFRDFYRQDPLERLRPPVPS